MKLSKLLKVILKSLNLRWLNNNNVIHDICQNVIELYKIIMILPSIRHLNHS